MAKNFSYRDLRIWQEAVELALTVYKATTAFPKYELYGIASQMRRAAVSISSNIAEGKGHSSDKDLGRFLFHARGSLLEPQTQIVIAQGLGYPSEKQAAELSQTTDDLGRGLNGLIQTVRKNPKALPGFANSERRIAISGPTPASPANSYPP